MKMDMRLCVVTIILFWVGVLQAREVMEVRATPSKSDLQADTTKMPVIGVRAKPYFGSWPTNKTKFIDSAYVHFLEAGGAKVAYIDYTGSISYLREMFSQINGVLFPGGAAALLKDNKLSPYAQAGAVLIQLAQEAYDKGDYFPVWGTCLGYELMMLVLSNSSRILQSDCNCNNYNAPLNFVKGLEGSRLFSGLSPLQLYTLGTEEVTFNNHNLYVALSDFYANSKLSGVMQVLATSVSKDKKKTYIAAAEGHKYPLYAVQFHPEKSGYVFDPEQHIVHTKTIIELMQRFSTFFIEEARKSKHAFATMEEEAKHLVYQGEIGFELSSGPIYLFK